MQLHDKTVVVTGAGQGIGRALAVCFAKEGAQLVVADKDIELAEDSASLCKGQAVRCDVSIESDIQALVSFTEQHIGPIDLFCSNAGVCFGEPDHAASASNDTWQRCWDIHVMSHVYAARAVLPGMLERGDGYLLNMASAAGLLSQIGDAAYSATKHAAVGLAESLSISHKDDGIRVSVICPQYVATAMLGYSDEDPADDVAGLLTPELVAESVLQGVHDEQFLILPHPEVKRYVQQKAADPDRWLQGMRRLRHKIIQRAGNTEITEMHKWLS